MDIIFSDTPILYPRSGSVIREIVIGQPFGKEKTNADTFHQIRDAGINGIFVWPFELFEILFLFVVKNILDIDIDAHLSHLVPVIDIKILSGSDRYICCIKLIGALIHGRIFMKRKQFRDSSAFRLV